MNKDDEILETYIQPYLFDLWLDCMCRDATYEGIESITEENELVFYIQYLQNKHMLKKDCYMSIKELKEEIDSIVSTYRFMYGYEYGSWCMLLYLLHADVENLYIGKKWVYATICMMQRVNWREDLFREEKYKNNDEFALFNVLKSSMKDLEYVLNLIAEANPLPVLDCWEDVPSVVKGNDVYMLFDGKVYTFSYLDQSSKRYNQFKYKRLYGNTFIIILEDEISHKNMIFDCDCCYCEDSVLKKLVLKDKMSEKAFKRHLVVKGVS